MQWFSRNSPYVFGKWFAFSSHREMRVETSNHAELERILVVDDAEPIRRMVACMLIQNGYDVLEAADGHEALNLVQRCPDPVHLVLTDLIMPRMSGAELARQLEKLRPGVKIVFMSGFAEDPLVRAFEPGFGFLSKPFTATALVHTVRQALAGAVADLRRSSSGGCPQ
jgi:two-component system, cell cycle sensor histidine kinase and response regulator CckA